MGEMGTGQPGVLYPTIYFMQLCSKEAPKEEAEVEKEDGKTSVLAQAKNSSCTKTGSGGGLRGAGVEWWEEFYKLHSSIGEETHTNSSACK